MDFRRGFSIGEENGMRIQGGTWIPVNPVTPAKPVPTRPQASIAQRNQLTTAKFYESMGFSDPFLHESSPISNGASASLNSMNVVHQQHRETNSWEEASIGKKRGSSHITGSYQEPLNNGAAATGWNNIACADLLTLADADMPCSDLLALADAGREQRGSHSTVATTTRNFFPFSLGNVADNQHQLNTANMLQNQDYSISSNQSNNNCPPQTPQYGFPVPYRHTNDLNSSPRTMGDAAMNGRISFQFEPVTPDKGRNEQINQHSGMLNLLLNERARHERPNMLEDEVNRVGAKPTEVHCQEPQYQSVMNSMTTAPELSQPAVDAVCAPPSAPLEEINPDKGEENGFDLNKTPQQKSKRRKVRPRVIKEGKPKKTPKTTGKQGNTKENQPAKRKYVRKNGTKTPNTPPPDAFQGIPAPNTCAPTKSCKRSLNFNSESQEERNGIHQTVTHLEEQHQGNLGSTLGMSALNTISESHAQELHSIRDKDASRNKSTLQLAHGLEVVVENSPAGIAFDLNRSLTQVLDDYISLPDKPAAGTPTPARNNPSRGNFKVLLGRIDNMGNAGGDSQNNKSNLIFPTESVRISGSAISSISTQSIHSHSQNIPKCNPNIPLAEGEHQRVLNRGHSHTHEEARHRSFNLIEGNLSSLQVYNEMYRRNEQPMVHFPEVYKKRRTEKGYRTISSKTSFLVTPRDGAKETMTKHNKGTGTQPSTSQGYNYFCPQFPNSNGAVDHRNGASNPGHDYYSQSLGTSHIHYMQGDPAERHSRKELSSTATHDKVHVSGFMQTLAQTEKTIKRSQGPTHTQVRDFASLTAVSECRNLPSIQPRGTPTLSDKQEVEIHHRTQPCMETVVYDPNARVEKYKHTNQGPAVGNSMSYSTTKEVMRQQSQAVVYSYHQSSKPKGSLKMVLVNSPLDEIIQKLSRLNINDVHNTVLAHEQNALVPYTGDGQMVAYTGVFGPIKKRKPRARVDLDPETDRVWKLLMGKESGNGADGTDAEKEKWWEEERRVFRGRADSFIARMHLIQGDRRFSKWTGSVVDSVIGVFLTQNVSDHLSSSAFMSMIAHFPLKPTRNERTCNEGVCMYVEEPDEIKWHDKMTGEPTSKTSPVTFEKAHHTEDREMGHCNESLGSNAGGGSSTNITKCTELFMCDSTPESSKNRPEMVNSGIECENLTEEDDGKLLEAQSSGVSSQNSVDSCLHITNVRATSIGTVTLLEGEERGALEDVVSSQNSIDSSVAVRSCSDSNSEEEEPTTTTGCKSNNFSTSTSFTELLQMAGSTMFQEFYSHGSGSLSSDHSGICCEQSEVRDSCKRASNLDRTGGQKFYSSNLEHHPVQIPINTSSNYSSCVTPNLGVLEVECPGAESRFSLPSAAETPEINEVSNRSGRIDTVTENVIETTTQQRVAFSCRNPQGERNTDVQLDGTRPMDPKILDDALTKRRNSGMQQTNLNPPSPFRGTSNVEENMFLGDQARLKETGVAESITKEQVYSLNSVSIDTSTNAEKAKRKPEKEKRKEFDWDSLRKEALHRCGRRERNHETMDSLDWEAVRCADVNEIAQTIKERGMNNMLAERIKDFLNRLVRDHESIDLEWLRDVPPDQAKEYLLSIRGLGLKSVECVRLLTLHHLAFPVDTNVGRIAVRLGWVPLQPLPESLQLHLLELYPIQESIQKYLWPRLCTLDQRTLYELHYQLITFGKVFCTKSKPNCNACPMRAECKHFASAFASARLALPGPEEKGIVNSTTPISANQSPPVRINPVTPMALPPPETNVLSDMRCNDSNSEPIIEVPASPEPECTEIQESDIEDAFFEDPDEIPTIELNIKDFATNLQNYMQANNMDLQEVDMSKALVALNPEAASIPTPKLKNVSRLRTEHQVYELPDSHPLLNGVPQRVPDDMCSYLLAIWTPGETAESIVPPEGCCSSQKPGNLCNQKTCFSCNSIREANSQTVRGTLLIPCKTAMRGSFPLNGTYFQVNEVFADHDSSLNPIDVPRSWLWNLPRRTVLFGTSIPSIFKGQTTEEIQSCFWRGYVCVRGFDQKTRAPRPLMARLHFPASRMVRTKTATDGMAKTKATSERMGKTAIEGVATTSTTIEGTPKTTVATTEWKANTSVTTEGLPKTTTIEG